MPGTNALPMERGNDGTTAILNEFETNAIGLLFVKALHMTGLTMVRISCYLASSVLLGVGSLQAQVQASGLGRATPRSSSGAAAARATQPESIPPAGLMASKAGKAPASIQDRPVAQASKLIVIGFMGGNVRPNNFVHREAKLTQTLQADYPTTIHAEIFANRHGLQAFQSILQQLAPHGALLTDAEKRAARIVIFGHSWGASETVALAKRLNRVGIPVLLTIQVDSVQKKSQNDAQIPPNVREAINFYQAEGLLRGRDKIVAVDPEKTAILGNFESSYRQNAISVADFPWYARAFMKPHVQIENDPTVWNKIQSLILAEIR